MLNNSEQSMTCATNKEKDNGGQKDHSSFIIINLIVIKLKYINALASVLPKNALVIYYFIKINNIKKMWKKECKASGSTDAVLPVW